MSKPSVPAAALPAHHFEVRVYYEDTDFTGVVYHAAYLHFLERGRTEFLRNLGIHHSELVAVGLGFAVRSMELQFDAPARIDDMLTVETAVESATGVRLFLRQTVLRGTEVLTRAAVTVVAIGPGNRPARLPATLRERLKG